MKLENGYTKLAEMLGLEVGQEFIVDENSESNLVLYNPYKMTTMGILDAQGDEMLQWVINALLRGEVTYTPIVKSLLTDDERERLEKFISCLDEVPESIKFYFFGNNMDKVDIDFIGSEVDSSIPILGSLRLNNVGMFRYYNENRTYTLEELGLED